MTEQTALVSPAESGYVELGELRMYYEVHGDTADGTPLVLLHGGLFDIEQQFGALIPELAAGRRVIAIDFQGHGRTNDIERPFSAAAFASDVLGVLDHLAVERADIHGFSVGGAVALDPARPISSAWHESTWSVMWSSDSSTHRPLTTVEPVEAPAPPARG
jgi:alpha-beta hydrolase superfamily lysophospholipase